MRTGREPRNGRERRAENRAREQLENMSIPKIEIVPLEDGEIVFRELDEAGNIVRETYGSIGK